MLTNLYPPHFVGGYELMCSRITTALARRGHEILVLTSTYGLDRPGVESGVHRTLRLRGRSTASQPRARAAARYVPRQTGSQAQQETRS